MGYLHIKNLCKNADIFLFKECYAMEKIHGTSVSIKYSPTLGITYKSGGEPYENFIKLFDNNVLLEKFKIQFPHIVDGSVIIYGEAYGGKQQAMYDTYGNELKFIAFDVCVNGLWLNVDQAERVAKNLGLDFVHYVKIPTTIEALTAERDKDSVQAVRNGMGTGKKREGIVCRPLVEFRKNNDERVICKYKTSDFSERKSKRDTLAIEPEKIKELEDARLIAEEWVTEMRLTHVLDKIGNPTEMSDVPKVIKAMIEDVIREAENEITFTKEISKAICKETVVLYKKRCIL